MNKVLLFTSFLKSNGARTESEMLCGLQTRFINSGNVRPCLMFIQVIPLNLSPSVGQFERTQTKGFCSENSLLIDAASSDDRQSCSIQISWSVRSVQR